MSWFKRKDENGDKKPRPDDGERTVRTEGLWQKCESCREIIWKKDLDATNNVCPKCGKHFRIDAMSRLTLLFDEGRFDPCDVGLVSSDPLEFVDHKPYSERLASMRQSTGLDDAVVSASGTLAGRKVRICAMEPKFIGGSMGSVMGEKITRAIECCIAELTPMIIVSASGGARMQEGAVSLMQMAKISSALMRLDESQGSLYQRSHRSHHRRRHRQPRHARRPQHR